MGITLGIDRKLLAAMRSACGTDEVFSVLRRETDVLMERVCGRLFGRRRWRSLAFYVVTFERSRDGHPHVHFTMGIPTSMALAVVKGLVSEHRRKANSKLLLPFPDIRQADFGWLDYLAKYPEQGVPHGVFDEKTGWSPPLLVTVHIPKR